MAQFGYAVVGEEAGVVGTGMAGIGGKNFPTEDLVPGWFHERHGRGLTNAFQRTAGTLRRTLPGSDSGVLVRSIVRSSDRLRNSAWPNQHKEHTKSAKAAGVARPATPRRINFWSLLPTVFNSRHPRFMALALSSEQHIHLFCFGAAE